MTEYGLQPSYIRLDYSSSYGPHSQTIPTVQWLPTPITGDMGSFVNWNTVPVDAEDMIDTLVAEAKTLLPTTTTYNLATIFNWDTGAEKFFPVATKALAVAGTVTPANVNKAVSFTLNMRTIGGQPFKMVFLDYVLTGAEFNKILPISFAAGMVDVAAILSSQDWGWSGRDNTRPAIPVSGTFDLNNALRKQYRMI